MKLVNIAALCMATLLLVVEILDCETDTFAKPNANRTTLYLDDESVAEVAVNPEGVVLSFPVKPTKVVLGKQKVFDLEYVENDLIIAPLANDATATLFVYMLGRRFTFHLVAAKTNSERIILVRDRYENRVKNE